MSNLSPISKNVPIRANYHIIFVHGLKWTSSRKYWISNEVTPAFNFPEVLQNALKDSKIWRFDFSGRLDIESVVWELIQKISSLQLKDDCKIVFITHSLGGIIVKELRRVLDNLHEKNQNKKIFDKISGVVFIATPHYGSEHAKSFNLFRFFRKTINTLLPDDPYLLNLDNKYARINFSKGIRHIEFYEKLPTNVTNNILIEFKNSLWRHGLKPIAYLFTPLNEMSYNLGCIVEKPLINRLKCKRIDVFDDHMTICKPKCKFCEVYDKVEKFLNEIGVKLKLPRSR